MKILIAGSSGFIGSALVADFKKQGHQVFKLVRSQDLVDDETAFWDPAGDAIDIKKLDRLAGDDGFGAVVNLAGQDLFKERWNPESKKRIWESRINSTHLLATSLGKLKIRPEVFVSASATGFYGNRGNELLNEDSAPPPEGASFLSDLVREWENMSRSAIDAGIRVVNPRTGIVLGTEGGMLKRVRTPFKIGLAAPLGEGTQYMSWITINDAIRAFSHLIATRSLDGPVNLTSPSPVTNLDFTNTLGYQFGKPVFMHAPAFMLRLIFGEAADEMLLVSQRVMPVRLKMTGFKFQHPVMEPALKYLLGG
ncbi:MAG: TIGR01777 family oxidoreductase [bacterium]|nr:TIGR01777 family oxidoreductase [bacterium]